MEPLEAEGEGSARSGLSTARRVHEAPGAAHRRPVRRPGAELEADPRGVGSARWPAALRAGHGRRRRPAWASRGSSRRRSPRSRRDVVQGRCLPYGEGITYWPVVEIVKQLGACRRARRPPPRSARCSARRSRRRRPRRSPGPSASCSKRARPRSSCLRRHPMGRGDLPRPGRARRPPLVAARRSCCSASRGRSSRTPRRVAGDAFGSSPSRRARSTS